MTINVQNELSKITSVISTQIPVSAIYLYGSYARGDNKADSDFDICLISNNKTKRRIDLATEAELSLIGVTSFSTDILAFYQDDFENRAKMVGTLENTILKQGVKLYG